MKLAIIGSRGFTDVSAFRAHMAQWFPAGTHIEAVVSGGAAGADTLGATWARENNIPIAVFPADWATYGRSAGYRRNVDIIKAADAVVAFWDGVSVGTKHSINIAHEARKPILIIYV